MAGSAPLINMDSVTSLRFGPTRSTGSHFSIFYRVLGSMIGQEFRLSWNSSLTSQGSARKSAYGRTGTVGY